VPSSVAKGNQYEIEVKKFLESQGWEVFRQHRKPLWIKGQMVTVGADIFGCDLVAKRDNQKTRWIQVSTVKNFKSKEEQVKNHVINQMWEDYEFWLRVKGKKEYKVYRMIGEIFQQIETIRIRKVNNAI